MKTYTLPINQETADYLQRLGMEVDARMATINFMFEAHKGDRDTSMFESVPFKHYQHELEEKMFEYSAAKKEFEKGIRPLVAKEEGIPEEEAVFDWNIEDFASLCVTITIRQHSREAA